MGIRSKATTDMPSDRRDDGTGGHARRRRRTIDAVVSAAYEELASGGYERTTVEGIARRAGVAPASVYNHFGSKAGVAQALAERALEILDRYVAAAWSLDATPLERLIAAGGATLRFSRQEPIFFRRMALSYLGAGDLMPKDTAAAQRMASRLREQLERFELTLGQAVAESELAPLNTRSTARFLLESWTGVLMISYPFDSGDDADETLAIGLEVFVQGLGGPSAFDRDGLLKPRYRRAITQAGTGQ